MEKDLKNLIKLLRKKGTIERKKLKSENSHYEGMCKGLWLGYEESASRLEKILRKYSK